MNTKIYLFFSSITHLQIILIIFAYFCGSIPFGPIFAKIFNLGNMREKGSGNIGATNMVRIGGKKLGIAVALCDGIKGVIPILLGYELNLHESILSVFCLAVVLGHIFPIWLYFKGGKGIATSMGAILALSWQVGIIYMISWLIIFKCSRISSLSSIISIIIMMIAAYCFLSVESSYFLMIMTIVIIVKHYDNILRLLRKSEK